MPMRPRRRGGCSYRCPRVSTSQLSPCRQGGDMFGWRIGRDRISARDISQLGIFTRIQAVFTIGVNTVRLLFIVGKQPFPPLWKGVYSPYSPILAKGVHLGSSPLRGGEYVNTHRMQAPPRTLHPTISGFSAIDDEKGEERKALSLFISSKKRWTGRRPPTRPPIYQIRSRSRAPSYHQWSSSNSQDTSDRSAVVTNGAP